MKTHNAGLAIVLLLAVLMSACGPPGATRQTTLDVSPAVEVQTPTAQAVAPALEGQPPSPSAPVLPADTIPWDEAASHIGERGAVCGPVAAATYNPEVNGSPTWLNIGRAYPDSSRFQVVIWGSSRGNFSSAPEQAYQGAFICVEGLIESYRGVAEMEVSSPSAISVQ